MSTLHDRVLNACAGYENALDVPDDEVRVLLFDLAKSMEGGRERVKAWSPGFAVDVLEALEELVLTDEDPT